MSVNTPVAIKENGKPQRADVLLSKEVAGALVQRILAGKTIFPPEGRIAITLGEGEGRETFVLSTNTIHNWIKRSNVVPETGMTLRSVLDKARLEKRTRDRERRQENMLRLAEEKMERTLKIRTNLPVIGMFGVIKDERGNIVRKENSQLLKVQMDTAQFLAERLNPERYGKVEKGEHKHLVFSLADLREAKKQQQGKTEI